MALHNFGGVNPGGVGSALTQPQLPSRSAPAPQEQLGLWQRFQQKLQTDPNFRIALLTTGLGLLKSPKFGESGFDVFADASLKGVGVLDQLRQRDIRGTERESKLTAEVSDRTRRTEVLEEGVELQRTQIDDARTNAAARIEVLEETNRIRDKDVAAKGGGIGVQQIFTNAIAKNLMTAFPNRYQGETGQAQAFLDAQIRSQQVTDPDRYRSQLIELTKLMTFDEGYGDLPLEEKLAIAAKILPQGGVGVSLSEPEPETNDKLVGRNADNLLEPGKSGTIAPAKSPGKYIIEYEDGTISGELTERQALSAIRVAAKRRRGN